MKKYLLLLAIACSALGHAQVWDNTSLWTGTTFRSAMDCPALQITNTTGSAINLTSVYFQGENDSAQVFDFFLADANGNVISNVYANEGVFGAHSLIGTAVTWTLAANTDYYIGAQSSTSNANYDYEFPSFHTQNGLTSTDNGNFSSFPNPAYYGNGAADMSWQLNGGGAVPEPMSMIALGPGVAGIIRRRRKA